MYWFYTFCEYVYTIFGRSFEFYRNFNIQVSGSKLDVCKLVPSRDHFLKFFLIEIILEKTTKYREKKVKLILISFFVPNSKIINCKNLKIVSNMLTNNSKIKVKTKIIE